jgi:hypothetical protein
LKEPPQQGFDLFSEGLQMKPRFTIALLWFVVVASAAVPAAKADPAQSAKALLSQCIGAMGGIDLLRSIETLSYESVQHTFFHRVEVSETLPQIIVYESNEVILQPKNYSLHEKSNWRWTDSAAQRNSQLTVTPRGGFSDSDNKETPITADGFYKALDIFAANTISVLLSGFDATDPKLGTPTDESAVVSFHQSIYGQQVATTIGISKQTHLLQWIETEHSYSQDVFASFWGRTVKRVVLSGWTLNTNGLYFPTKWQLSTNGTIDGQESIFSLKINPDVPASQFAIPEEFKNSFEALHMTEESLALRNHGAGKHLEVHDGVVMLPGMSGAYNSLLVNQGKGIVVIDAPYTNANSDYVIAYAKKVFPGMPITGVVSTNQLQFHLGGLPAYAKVHAPIYLLDANVALMRRFLAAQVSVGEIRESDIKLRTVTERTAIGSGENQIIIIPFRGTASARMMAVYFPAIKLLYCSDLYLPQQWGGQYYMEHLAEIRDLIDREHIDVLQISGVSMVPHDWKELSALIPAAQIHS